MPGASDAVLARLEANIARVPSPSRVLAQAGLDTLEALLLADLDPSFSDERELAYRCRCSRDRFLTQLALLNDTDRADLLADDEKVVAECHFCGTEYHLTRLEIEGSN